MFLIHEVNGDISKFISVSNRRWGNFLIGVGLFRTGLIKVEPNKVRWVMKFVELIFQFFRGLIRVRSFEEPMDF